MVKYGEGDGWWKPKEVEGAYGITFWKGITKKWDRFEKGIKLFPGEGSTIYFGHDIWMGENPLSTRF